jgi:hypothetical protein
MGYVFAIITSTLSTSWHIAFSFFSSGVSISRRYEAVQADPNTNAIGQQVLDFDTTTSMGSRMHLTQLPA